MSHRCTYGYTAGRCYLGKAQALPGEYTVKVLVNDKDLAGKAVVMHDHWHIRQW